MLGVEIQAVEKSERSSCHSELKPRALNGGSCAPMKFAFLVLPLSRSSTGLDGQKGPEPALTPVPGRAHSRMTVGRSSGCSRDVSQPLASLIVRVKVCTLSDRPGAW